MAYGAPDFYKKRKQPQPQQRQQQKQHKYLEELIVDLFKKAIHHKVSQKPQKVPHTNQQNIIKRAN